MKYIKDYQDFLTEKQVIDKDYFEGGSETMFKEDELESIDDVIKKFLEGGIYVFKLDDDRLFQLTDYLKDNNVEYGETSQLGSDVTVYNPEKFPKFGR